MSHISNNVIDIDEDNWIEKVYKSKDSILMKNGIPIGIINRYSNFNIRPVSEIFQSDFNYLIKSYQRGYRWGKEQIEDLLNDISNIRLTDKNVNYSLQPLVLSRLQGKTIEVLDGQQRLTTLYLILKVLGQETKISLTYESRKDSSSFLKNIHLDSINPSNLDFYYFKKAYDTIKEYFNGKDSIFKKDWLEKLFSKTNGAVFIEYYIDSQIDKRDNEKIFINLNDGKIPLENSELIKALFLKEDNNSNEELNMTLEIAREWDYIEIKLRDANFWSWLGRNVTDSPHIDMILDIVAQNLDNSKKRYSYFSYHVFLKQIEEIGKKELWKIIKKCFMIFDEWYNDKDNYHLVGFLNNCKFIKYNNDDFYNRYIDIKNETKNIFHDLIKKEFLDKLKKEELDYDNNKTYDYLLLFNIITYIKNDQKFNFEKYKNTDYDIEHIFPRSNIEEISSEKKQDEWLTAIKESKLFNDILEDNVDGDFSEIYKDVIYKYNGAEDNKIENVDRLGNLCLLSSDINRSIKNIPFPLKVKSIINDDKNGFNYLFQGTRNVFLKYYTDININNYLWTETDAISYEKTIVSTINEYFNIK